MTKFKITATAPTSYQIRSLGLFGLNIKSYPTGEHVGELEFETEESAKKYLTNRAEWYFFEENELKEALTAIEKYGCLTMDAVTGRIEEIEE